MTPEYLILESELWLGSQEQWDYLMVMAITYLRSNPLATPEDFAYYVISQPNRFFF